jgi:chaperonin GroEL (HSP60 family)
MPSDSNRTAGRDAQRTNILAAKLVAEIVRTTLGPKGMDKMLVDSVGDITVTNDGVTILSEMEIEHPTAKMIVEIAKTQEDEVGDGTTECTTDSEIHSMLAILISDNELLSEMNKNILKAKQNGIYDGAYKVVELAVKNS